MGEKWKMVVVWKCILLSLRGGSQPVIGFHLTQSSASSSRHPHVLFHCIHESPLWSSSCASCLPACLPPANLTIPHPWFYVDALICLPYFSALAILVWIQVSQKHDACRASIFSPGVMETRHLQSHAKTSLHKQKTKQNLPSETTGEKGTVVLLVFGPFTGGNTILSSNSS